MDKEQSLMYIGNLPADLKLPVFYKIITAAGRETVSIVMKPVGRCYGFALFDSKQSAERAVQRFPCDFGIDGNLLKFQIVSSFEDSTASPTEFSLDEATLLLDDVAHRIVVLRNILEELSANVEDNAELMEEADCDMRDISFTLRLTRYMLQTLLRGALVENAVLNESAVQSVVSSTNGLTANDMPSTSLVVPENAPLQEELEKCSTSGQSAIAAPLNGGPVDAPLAPNLIRVEFTDGERDCTERDCTELEKCSTSGQSAIAAALNGGPVDAPLAQNLIRIEFTDGTCIHAPFDHRISFCGIWYFVDASGNVPFKYITAESQTDLGTSVVRKL